MRQMKIGYVFFILLFISSISFANNLRDISKAGQEWKRALSSENPEKIAALYAPSAYLYATFKNVVHGKKNITAYFVDLMKNPHLKVQFTDEHVRVFDNVGINSGLYIFSYKNEGKTVTVPARYTFVYVKENGRWMIVDHHSSVLPEKNNG